MELCRKDVGMATDAILALRHGGDADIPELEVAGAFLVAEFFSLIRGLTKKG